MYRYIDNYMNKNEDVSQNIYYIERKIYILLLQISRQKKERRDRKIISLLSMDRQIARQIVSHKYRQSDRQIARNIVSKKYRQPDRQLAINIDSQIDSQPEIQLARNIDSQIDDCQIDRQIDRQKDRLQIDRQILIV